MTSEYLKKSAGKFYKKLLNTIDGQDFNRLAHWESRNSTKKYIDPDNGPHDDFELVEMRTRRRAESSEGDFMIDDGPSVMQKLISRFTEKALHTAAEAAGYSKEAAVFATKYVAVEMARDVGWMINCPTAVEVMRNVKRRFSVLEDIQRAYEDGARGVAVLQEMEMVRTHAPIDGVNHPLDVNVASNLDDLAIIRDDSIRPEVAFLYGRALEVRGRRRERD
ncbi:uncharacterized protein RCC_02125 [Ramularia collo-cygni]|uniref:Uncharacterized protein n=1 Tax=Ramularia collo-cygni TaxID=112498 RepID=A0A2D3V7F2_9PEZI|nr:uncharacterized protein RCC_02125 [Ramularia collo-cygni]CZT16283.1 uncharacterized protein RCC_02125 [Ramularia collo-cygni]